MTYEVTSEPEETQGVNLLHQKIKFHFFSRAAA